MQKNLETETKFIGVSFEALKQMLTEHKAQASAVHFERNILFDTSEKNLLQTNKLLRLRTQFYQDKTQALLTFKQPDYQQKKMEKHIRSQQEYESYLTNPEAMIIILEGLGYTPVLGYEKIRQEWHWRNTVWCFDILPFSKPDCFVLEIEGSVPDIAAIMQEFATFGLTPENASCKSYYRLNSNWREKMHLPPSKSFTFDAEHLKNIENELKITIPAQNITLINMH